MHKDTDTPKHLNVLTICKNCDYKFSGNYCSNCGQKSTVSTINFKDIFHEGWHNLTHTDKGYLQLFWEMIAKPGITIKNYLSGKRKRYFSPFTFYLVTTSLLILMTHWVFEREDENYHINNEFGNFTAQNLNYVLLCSLPIISLLLYSLFRKSFKNFAEAFTVMMFAYGALNFYLLAANIFFYIFISLHYHYNNYAVLFGYVFLFYILYHFLKPLRFWTLLKLLFLIVFFYFFIEVFGKGLLLYIYGVPLKLLMNSIF